MKQVHRSIYAITAFLSVAGFSHSVFAERTEEPIDLRLLIVVNACPGANEGWQGVMLFSGDALFVKEADVLKYQESQPIDPKAPGKTHPLTVERPGKNPKDRLRVRIDRFDEDYRISVDWISNGVTVENTALQVKKWALNNPDQSQNWPMPVETVSHQCDLHQDDGRPVKDKGRIRITVSVQPSFPG